MMKPARCLLYPSSKPNDFILRPLVRSDAKTLIATLSDSAQCLYLSRGPFENEEELATWLLDPNWNGRSWAAVDKAGGAVTGRFVVVPTKEAGMSDLGYITVSE